MKPKHLLSYLAVILMIISVLPLNAQKKKKSNTTNSEIQLLLDSTFSGIQFRGIGPAFMSGRIADIAIHPENENTWIVGVGSGGVWKTTNAGTTWKSVFDGQTSYSIGCVTIDQLNPNIVWVGTGENVGGRHVGYGDGVYKSMDGGESWTNMGLKNSEHISKIVIHPENSDIIWVAAQGPLWSKGGERGLYKSIDGGKTWNKTLGNEEWTGVTDILIDPRNPDVLYAATWDRHRTVAAYMGGGPGSGIHKSTDGGETWTELTKGLPEENMGKIGLAISPQNPDIIYAAIELKRRTGGVYKSTDRGASWTKQSDAVSGATGPHYYQELYASPHHFDRLYLVDVWMQYSTDGGKTFNRFSNESKHSDNHAIAFKKDDPNYMLVGTDGGLYESFDLAKTWKFIENLPVTQFYKVAVDDAEPFYNVFGGTQDNSTEGGPSRTDNYHGIQNSDWRVVLNWDGHQPATEPGNPNIMYGERQEGNISRIDMITGEVTDIQPQPTKGEPHERFNWDAPILVSPHDPKTLLFASYRVWKSEDRGDSWTAISGDLTRNQNRIELPIMGRKQSYDNPWDFLAMSNYNTITSLAQSPQNENIIYAGTDDGLIQVTNDGGENWRKIEVGNIAGIPSTAFVNDIKADLFEENTVYAALDNHKYGDFSPYLIKSTDQGKTWTSIKSNIPEKTLVWRIVQDHIDKDLLFAATEFGIYFTIDGGSKWIKFESLPTISFRDLAIQRRENDLIGASFGRGFYILDDYQFLRDLSKETLKEEAILFPTRKAWWYIPKSHLGFNEKVGSQGNSHFTAPNPDFGAVFRYYLKEGYKSKAEIRKEAEKILNEKKADIPFPGYDELAKEASIPGPEVWLTIKNSNGDVIKRIAGDPKKGFHTIAWDLRYPAPETITLKKPEGPENELEFDGLLAPPGKYSATLSKVIDGVSTILSGPVEFEVVPLREGALEGATHSELSSFLRDYEDKIKRTSKAQLELGELNKQIKAIERAIEKTQAEPGTFASSYQELVNRINNLNTKVNGNQAQAQAGEKTDPTINDRMFAIYKGISHSTYGPTDTHAKTMEIIDSEIKEIEQEINSINSEMKNLADKIVQSGGPYIEGIN
ncbi:VPS10 domain-containing protein [Marinigracilibium pacificum]|uniref:Glycosyl hydrolase n=1 Tax=Marinigracilibium pacificum TaxID=2729599 RepID=A0A848IWX4_9BACT|nr:glycosyl hydrolase [Marinigracilibium pacificum]NMM49033.1 glycosyl hydrolase [Marinigracilibium pacificum]